MRDVVCRRLLAGGFVQLFYLGARYFLGRRCLFDFRLFFAVLDQEMFLILHRQLANRRNANDVEAVAHPLVVPDTIVKSDPVEPCADTTRRCVELNAVAASDAAGPATQNNVVLTAPGSFDDEILLIQNGISSDTSLRDAIVAPRALLVRAGIVTLRGSRTCY